jgi:hypothetical protein
LALNKLSLAIFSFIALTLSDAISYDRASAHHSSVSTPRRRLGDHGAIATRGKVRVQPAHILAHRRDAFRRHVADDNLVAQSRITLILEIQE